MMSFIRTGIESRIPNSVCLTWYLVRNANSLSPLETLKFLGWRRIAGGSFQMHLKNLTKDRKMLLNAAWSPFFAVPALRKTVSSIFQVC